MGRNAFLIVFFLAMVVLLLTFTSQGLFVLERIALIDQLEGRAEVERAGSGKVVRAKVGLPVKTGDTVITGPGSWLRLHWADGTTMRIGPDSRVKVEKCHFNTSSKREESLFSLTVGVVLASLRKRLSQGSLFEIETPVAVAGVRGTQFMVRSTGRGCSVSVLRGAVEVRSGRAKAKVLPGEGADVPSKGLIRKRRMSSAEGNIWRSELPDLLAPHLRLLGPPDGSIVGAPEVEVLGITDTFATVTVNGRKVRPDRRGRFRARVKLRRGTNTIEVVADDGAGHRTIKTLTVHFGRPSKEASRVLLDLSVEPPVIPADGVSSAIVRAKVLINGRPAPDGTPVSFRASAGRIAPHAVTKDGRATATYRAPLEGKEAEIKASCYGVEATSKVKLVEAL